MRILINRLIFVIALGVGSTPVAVRAQDGKLIDKMAVEFPEGAYTQIETNFPGARDIMKSVRLYRITYLSDGLKVKGYLAAPKSG